MDAAELLAPPSPGSAVLVLKGFFKVDDCEAATGAWGCKLGFGFVGGRFLRESSAMMSCGIEVAADGPLRSNDSDLEVAYVVTCLRLLLDDKGDVELPGRDLCFVQESRSPSCHLSLLVIQWRTFSLEGTGGGAIKELADASVSRHRPLSPKSPPFLPTELAPTLTTPLLLRPKCRSLPPSPMSSIAPESAENVDPFSISLSLRR